MWLYNIFSPWFSASIYISLTKAEITACLYRFLRPTDRLSASLCAAAPKINDYSNAFYFPFLVTSIIVKARALSFLSFCDLGKTLEGKCLLLHKIHLEDGEIHIRHLFIAWISLPIHLCGSHLVPPVIGTTLCFGLQYWLKLWFLRLLVYKCK